MALPAAEDSLASRGDEDLTPRQPYVRQLLSPVPSLCPYRLVYRNKAVAEGAVSFALEHFVGSRVAPMTYGVCIDEVYVPDKIEHLARQSHTYIDVTGKKMVKNRFLVLVSRVGSYIHILIFTDD